MAKNFLRTVLKGNTIIRKEGVIYVAFIFFLREKVYLYL